MDRIPTTLYSPSIPYVESDKKMTRVPRMGPAPIQSQSTFLRLERLTQIYRSQFANSEGDLRPWALLSQDAGPAAHELSLPDGEKAAHGARLQRGVQSVDEAPAAHER